MNNLQFTATENDQNRSIFKFIIKMFPNVPLSRLERLFREREIKINGKKVSSKQQTLNENDVIKIYGLDLTDVFKSDEKIKHVDDKISNKFDVIYEDDNVLVVNKNANISIHGLEDEVDLNYLIIKYLNFKQTDSFVPASIGRIDRATSGIVVYAKNYATLRELNEKQQYFRKIYAFIPKRSLERKDYNIELNLNEDFKNRGKMVISKVPGTLAITKLFYDVSVSSWMAEILTGKKHQIRLSLVSLNNAIKGDKKYNGFSDDDKRLFLHAYSISFANLSSPLTYLNGKTITSRIPWKMKHKNNLNLIK